MRPFAWMFHHFHGGGHPPGQGAIAAQDFEGWIRDEPNLLSADEWLERALNGTLDSDDRCITFDDGLRSQIDVALPILERHRLTAMWFVHSSALGEEADRLELYRFVRLTVFDDIEDFHRAFEEAALAAGFGDRLGAALPAFDPETYLSEFSFYTPGDRRFRFLRDQALGPERYHMVMDAMLDGLSICRTDMAAKLHLRREDLAHLAREGHVVGLHSHDHPTRLAELPIEAQTEQYRLNAECLAETIGAWPVTAAHPCNSYGPETLTILRELGVRVAFRSNCADVPDDPLQWPREDAAHLPVPTRNSTQMNPA